MNIRTGISIALIILAVGLTFWLFVRPIIVPASPELVGDDQLMYVGENVETGEASYFILKEEIKEWSKILANFVPLLAILLAYILKKRK